MFPETFIFTFGGFTIAVPFDYLIEYVARGVLPVAFFYLVRVR